MAHRIPLIDLAAQRERIGPRLEDAVIAVVRHGAYVGGPEVGRLEEALSAFCGARHTIACANGTDALQLVLMALGVGPGDAVLCPSFTFAATAEAVALVGGTPVFVDVTARDFNLDPAHLPEGLRAARTAGLRPVGVIAVDLFGQTADYEAIERFCDSQGLWLIADAAQSFGASHGSRKVGTIGRATTTSFFPAKPLGCYGDGGALFTDDDALADKLRSIRNHGQGADRYDYRRLGLNSRLDTIQAAILLEKLAVFAGEIAARNAVAERYHALLDGLAELPLPMPGRRSVWAQYTLRHPRYDRDVFKECLEADGVSCAIYYPRGLHRQPAYEAYPVAGGELPVTDALCREVVSLPMHADLDEHTQDRVVAAVRRAFAAAAS